MPISKILFDTLNGREFQWSFFGNFERAGFWEIAFISSTVPFKMKVRPFGGSPCENVGEVFGDDYDYIYGIVTVTEWYFILFTSDGISCMSKNPLNIQFSESALKEGSEEEKELHKNVKWVMKVIEG
ncbi:hypothetical protein C1645_811676 [Glomus cerebriforme]|uniref:Uncharacterized protein n=1 Tax=Glomus cerebriforme TaxID=658196 RepID=A0A397TRF3_9GLOM|nr:hypothetical protein C1645_811676 [Glomus cerebriforme]